MDAVTKEVTLVNFASLRSPDDFVLALETCLSESTPRRLRAEEARSIIDIILKVPTLQREHLERIIVSAQRSADFFWEIDDQGDLRAIEQRRVARLYDVILDTAQKKLEAISNLS